MKKTNYSLLLLIVVALFATSCGKDGAVGPSGATGPIGLQGAVGATGADGTKIYTGTAVPATTLGAAGDFYLNVSNNDFYGPKTSSGWGVPTNLKGAAGTTGATGAAGSKIYSGTGVPATSLAANGDYYLDVASYLFYGPKNSGAWGTPVNLKGPKGDPGTANVIYSDWYTPIEPQPGIFSIIKDASYNISALKITQAILDHGTVMVYGRLNGYSATIWPTDQVAQFPIIITSRVSTLLEIDNWAAVCSVGNIHITLTDEIGSYRHNLSQNSFRYVIIPGGVLTTSTINFKNYDEVKRALRLPD